MSKWRIEVYGSGTHLVSNPDLKAYYYVYGPMSEKDDTVRYKMCEQLRDWLNNEGEKPSWLNDMERINETWLEGTDDSSIQAMGFWVDAKPPSCAWVMDESFVAQNARANLIDKLQGIVV